MPDLAYQVLDICITHIGDKHKIVYDFQFLEDHCSIQQWQHDMTTQTKINQPIHKSWCPILDCHRPIKFESKFHHRPLPAYTKDSYTLVHNNVLSVMCKCAKQIDLRGPPSSEGNVIFEF